MLSVMRTSVFTALLALAACVAAIHISEFCAPYTEQGIQQFTSFSFSGDVTLNGQTTKYSNQSLPFPPGWKGCYSHGIRPNQLIIQTLQPNGDKTTNMMHDVDGRISGTMGVPTAGGFFSLTLNGTGRFS